ncbi:MAG: hypothetical protein JNL21_32700 [Myxococcales bacterium]|nr:hypothetical protein [Myxococcales bacterium]
MLKSLSWLAVPAALLFFSGRAEAAPRSLAAATARLPETVDALATTHLKGVRATKLFSSLFPALLEEADELADGLAKVKKVCQIDAVSSIEDATFAGTTGRDGAIFLAITGVDEAKAVACATKVAKAEMGGDAKSEKVTWKAEGTLYRLSSDKSKDELFFAWLPGDIVVIADDPEDKAQLEKMVSGKGNIKKSKVASRLSKLDPNAAVSAVWGKAETFEGKTIKGGAVTVKVAGGQVTAEASAEMESSKDAQEVVSMIELAKSFLGKMSPRASVEARASGADVLIRADVPEADLIKAADEAMPKKRKR